MGFLRQANIFFYSLKYWFKPDDWEIKEESPTSQKQSKQQLMLG